MKRHALTLAMLLSAAPAWADPPQLVIAPEIPATAGDWVLITPTTTAKAVVFIGLDGLSSFPSSELKDPRKLVVNPQKDGRYRFLAVGTLNDEMTVTPFAVVVGTQPAPGPGPGPNPDDPDPFGAQVHSSPNAGTFRVLIVYETADLSKLPPGQMTVLTSGDVRNYLNSHCANGPDGRTKEWRVWDQNTDLTNAGAAWQGVMKKPRASLPWLYVGNGSRGYSGPLPKTVEDTLKLLQKYGGP